jgi:hypothetical protein
MAFIRPSVCLERRKAVTATSLSFPRCFWLTAALDAGKVGPVAGEAGGLVGGGSLRDLGRVAAELPEGGVVQAAGGGEAPGLDARQLRVERDPVGFADPELEVIRPVEEAEHEGAVQGEQPPVG